MSLHHDPTALVPRDADGDPTAPTPGSHTLVLDRDGDGWKEPHSEHWACSCGQVISSWVQSDPDHSDKPFDQDVYAAHAAHVREAHLADSGDAVRFVTVLADAVAWMRELADSDGPDFFPTAHLKVAAEAQEVAEAPDDITETADVAICLAASTAHQGWTLAQITEAITAKTARNRLRRWTQNADGTWQHVRTTSTPDPVIAPAIDDQTGLDKSA